MEMFKGINIGHISSGVQTGHFSGLFDSGLTWDVYKQ